MLSLHYEISDIIYSNAVVELQQKSCQKVIKSTARALQITLKNSWSSFSTNMYF